MDNILKKGEEFQQSDAEQMELVESVLREDTVEPVAQEYFGESRYTYSIYKKQNNHTIPEECNQ